MGKTGDRRGWAGLVGARLTKIDKKSMVSDVTYYIRLRFWILEDIGKKPLNSGFIFAINVNPFLTYMPDNYKV